MRDIQMMTVLFVLLQMAIQLLGFLKTMYALIYLK